MTTRTARLRLRNPASLDGYVDGAWWPRTRDLPTELSLLLDDLTIDGHPVSRVIFNRSFWSASVRQILVGDHVVRLGGFTTPGTNMVNFIDNTGSRRRLDVLVIDPDADPSFAERALELASTTGNALRAADIISQSQSAA